MRATVTLALILLSLAFTVQAQQILPSDRFYLVPQDNQYFFFQPSQVSPHQAGVFGDVMEQFSDHLLSSINRNPANLSQLDDRSYFYIDLKTLPDETIESYYPRCNNCFTTGPNIFRAVDNRTVREPFLSAVLFMNPYKDSGLRFGLTYQLLSINEPFNRLRPSPYSLYYNRSLGLTTGLFTPSTNIPGERDQYRLQGHFPSLYTGYEFSARFSAGLKVSYNYYTVLGSGIAEGFGNHSDTAIPPQATEYSTHRNVTYSHWDFSAGIRAGLTDRSTAGISVGYLTGNFDQDTRLSLHQVYEDYNLNGDDFYFTNFGDLYGREGVERDGHTIYASADYEYRRNENSHISLYYRISRADQDFNFGSYTYTFSDTENYSLNNQGENQYWTAEEELTTRNSGSGSSELWQHQFSASYSLNLTENFRLRSGFQVNFNIDKESFSELQQRRASSYSYRETDGETTFDRLSTTDFRHLNSMAPAKYQFTGYLPLILGRSFGRHFFAELGVMGHYRSAIRKQYQIKEYENRHEVIYNGEVRVTEYQTRNDYDLRRHDSSTLFNAFGSISFSPDDQLRIRLMTYSDRRKMNPDSSIDAIRFQLSAEIGF